MNWPTFLCGLALVAAPFGPAPARASAQAEGSVESAESQFGCTPDDALVAAYAALNASGGDSPYDACSELNRDGDDWRVYANADDCTLVWDQNLGGRLAVRLSQRDNVVKMYFEDEEELKLLVEGASYELALYFVTGQYRKQERYTFSATPVFFGMALQHTAKGDQLLGNLEGADEVEFWLHRGGKLGAFKLGEEQGGIAALRQCAAGRG